MNADQPNQKSHPSGRTGPAEVDLGNEGHLRKCPWFANLVFW